MMPTYIKQFNSRGELLGTIGRKGMGPGEFSGPEFAALEVSNGHLIVWEEINRRLSVFTLKGERESHEVFDEGESIWKIRGLANGQIYY